MQLEILFRSSLTHSLLSFLKKSYNRQAYAVGSLAPNSVLLLWYYVAFLHSALTPATQDIFLTSRVRSGQVSRRSYVAEEGAVAFLLSKGTALEFICGLERIMSSQAVSLSAFPHSEGQSSLWLRSPHAENK